MKLALREKIGEAAQQLSRQSITAYPFARNRRLPWRRARSALGITASKKLQKNDMPPNPAEFNSGFLTWPTDGKKPEPVIAGDSHPIAACMIAPEPVRKAQEALMAAKK